jgi:hypothetical protein
MLAPIIKKIVNIMDMRFARVQGKENIMSMIMAINVMLKIMISTNIMIMMMMMMMMMMMNE